MRVLLTLTALMTSSEAAVAQHCGGPCEIPRPAAAPVSPNPRFTLEDGVERKNWRYLHNFIWTEDGVQRFRLEEVLASPPMNFGHRRIFLSPAGNGFLVTGNAYVEKWTGEGPQLFVFCRRDGEVLTRVGLKEALSEEERVPGPCPAGCGCENVLYTFERDPALSPNEGFVDLVAAGTSRTLSFFLPLGSPIGHRRAFELRLAELDWNRVPAERRAGKRAEIESLVAALDDPDAAVRANAEEALIAVGYLALPALRSRSGEQDAEEVGSRHRRVESLLRPWADVGYEAMSIDLDLLAGLLTYPEAPVAAAARTRLAEILPAAEPREDWPRWIAEHRTRLRWDPESGRYVDSTRDR